MRDLNITYLNIAALKPYARYIQIEKHATESDNHIIAAATLLGEARRRVEDGEAGQIKWSEWVYTNIKLSKSRLYELNHIAEADNPEAELKRLRKQTSERVRRHRKKKAEATRAEAVRAEALRDSDEERRNLIAWARKAPIEKVRTVLSLIASEGDVTAAEQNDESTSPDQQEAA